MASVAAAWGPIGLVDDDKNKGGMTEHSLIAIIAYWLINATSFTIFFFFTFFKVNFKISPSTIFLIEIGPLTFIFYNYSSLTNLLLITKKGLYSLNYFFSNNF